MPVAPDGSALPYARDQGGGDPLAALLGGQAPAASMGGQAPSAPMGGDGPDSGEFAKSMLELIDEWRQVETDEEDLLMIEQISTMVQKLLARNSKEAMDAMQGKLSPRMLAQSYGQG